MNRELLDTLYEERFEAIQEYRDLSEQSTFAGCSNCECSVDYEVNKAQRKAAEARVVFADKAIDRALQRQQEK